MFARLRVALFLKMGQHKPASIYTKSEGCQENLDHTTAYCAGKRPFSRMSEQKENEETVTPTTSDKASKESAAEYEQHCLLFPTYATRHSLDDKAELTDHWNIRIRGWAFSTPKTSRTRALFLGLTQHLAEIQKADFQSRASLFWASNIDHKEFTARAIGVTDSRKMTADGDPTEPSVEQLANEPSAKEAKEDVKNIIDNAQKKLIINHPEDETPSIRIMPVEGNFSGHLPIPHNTVKKWLKEDDKTPFFSTIINTLTNKNTKKIRMLKIAAFQDTSPHPTYGIVDLVEPEGFSVISDIDDTIKDTEILSSTRTILSNTFLQPFRAVDGMSELYHEWYDKEVSFHYVSNSPWQLYPMLRSFFNTYNFPPGSAHLKFYDGIVKSVKEQKEHPMASKLMYIHQLLKDFPLRKFILVGDTGELDPEIYTKIARENEGRILRIFVRDVSTPHLEGLPAQPAHHSYAQTFTSTCKHLRNHYVSSEEVEGSPKNATATVEGTASSESVTAAVAETSREVVSEAKDSAEEQQKKDSLTSRLMNHFHSEISYLHTSLGLQEQPAEREVLKTPLEQFHFRIESLGQGLPEGLFTTFTDPNELRNDPVIRKALKYS
ncbi:16275_t:CDS:10 [Acaulospora colombiana]|uniref:16275_t:CDS:1 n=1 Tax=Acaulospora colombiana TaxID=27376 RepID=A0ACA9KBT6_9GLOM|nr:16275_t:CDS:10 [Acaulospora colombiana]